MHIPTTFGFRLPGILLQLPLFSQVDLQRFYWDRRKM